MKSTTIIKSINKNNENFPQLLKTISDCPNTIYFLGNLPNNKIPLIAIVGTRKASYQGKIIAKKLAQELSTAGFIIVSGLALGIDKTAHEGALLGPNPTIAVLANGLDKIYPSSHTNLAMEILNKNGCIISEYPEKTPPLPHQFLARNRIISGLSIATIVVEAPIHSGSLVTAKYALDQGREVFVVPGSILEANYAGSNLLLRFGARIITQSQDVIEDLQNILQNYNFNIQNLNDQTTINNEQNIILNAITNNKTPLTIDKIIQITKLEPQIVSTTITILLLENKIKETPQGFTI
ncbi:MAG: DNA-processing protein DprA [Minisyncoccia bacterium]